MEQRIQGLNRTPENETSECTGEGGSARADAAVTFATLHFHPKCAARLEDSIREKRRALLAAVTEAIPSIESTILRLERNPDGIDPSAAARIVDMLDSALGVMRATLTSGAAPDRDALNRQKREMLALQSRLASALRQVRAGRG